ncbi:hypothetical protein SIL81_16375 [Xanthomonas campestris pv. incanae]|uniref:hypothetical protein n=1 Tax=Xanthomonas campestris TaxID=339 RepID=UPI001CC09C7F|nr:hypothetical protein [Xanthomonas campestris]MCC5068566.1 hypothetical protein [Xanthomonas campestris]MCC5085084.1 hypothetical protein [Xanthomonas campestris]MDX6083469.1 hypothetical protein [Xanthomonas campestris pv. incanae]MDX6085466.1 hypothetical protein [Xanthomonas campestris pv. incanae]MDX6140732.1 hypothetical protein [Xanthomonas campestris pv. incanae]
MKSASCLVGLSLLLAAMTAHAQSAPVCPPLPPASGLQWTQLAGADYLVCKATTADGRQVVGVMLTTRDPAMALARDRRAEKGQIQEEEFYWYKLDLGGREVPGMESRRVTVVELGKKRYAQLWIDGASTEELASMQSLVQNMDLQPASLALQR